MLDFTTIDFETANSHRGSPCSVGLVRVRNGQIVESQHWLIRPPEGADWFDGWNIAIHKITAEMVANAPRCYRPLDHARGTKTPQERQMRTSVAVRLVPRIGCWLRAVGLQERRLGLTRHHAGCRYGTQCNDGSESEADEYDDRPAQRLRMLKASEVGRAFGKEGAVWAHHLASPGDHGCANHNSQRASHKSRIAKGRYSTQFGSR